MSETRQPTADEIVRTLSKLPLFFRDGDGGERRLRINSLVWKGGQLVLGSLIPFPYRVEEE